MRWTWAVLLGIALGAATAAVDVVAGGLDQTPAWRAVSMLLNAGCVWAGLAVLGGWILGTPWRGALAGVGSLASAVGAYYGYGLISGDRAGIGFGGTSGTVRMWLVLAVVAGPLLGSAGALARRSGLVGTIAALVVPVGATVEMLVLRSLGPEAFRVDPWQAWTQVAVVVAAVGGAALAVARTSRPRLTSGRWTDRRHAARAGRRP